MGYPYLLLLIYVLFWGPKLRGAPGVPPGFHDAANQIGFLAVLSFLGS